MVHSSLNIDRIREGGSNAENINFGVKGAVVRSFLARSGIEPQLDPGGPLRTRADIVREARGLYLPDPVPGLTDGPSNRTVTLENGVLTLSVAQ